MNRIVNGCTLLMVCGVTSLAVGRAPLIDPPTPPPCAADGSCYPNTCEWGYYPGRWRLWPGANLQPTPSKSPSEAAGRISPELGPSETPPADLEDAAAPPSSPKREEPTEKTPAPPGEKPAEGQSLEPQLPSVPLPDVETQPLGPTSEHDPPPALPRSLSMGLNAAGQSQAQSAARPAAVRPTAASRVSTSDPPPSPPWAQSAAL